MLFIEYPKCTTCKRAKKFLDEHNYHYIDRNIKESNPTEKELVNWIEKSGLPINKWFNTSGTLYRQMNLKDKLKGMSEKEQIQLLASDGMLVKRPILITDKQIFIGFKEIDWIKLNNTMQLK